MKTLLLLRHANADWKDGEFADHERPLNDRGKREAPRVGQLIAQEKLAPDIIVTSSAERARETADYVAKHCQYEGSIQPYSQLYDSSLDKYLSVLSDVPDDCASLLIVGHNPLLEQVLEVLTGQYRKLATATLAQVTLQIDSWQCVQRGTQAELMNLWRPAGPDP